MQFSSVRTQISHSFPTQGAEDSTRDSTGSG